MEQTIVEIGQDYELIDFWFRETRTPMIVCGRSAERLKIYTYLKRLETRLKKRLVYFQNFEPNPTYESVVDGVKLFRNAKCDSILAIGGGSAMDVAKCIKLFSNSDGTGANGAYLRQEIVQNDIPFAAMPTTAGTGSEATHFAVVYYDGFKQSVAHDSALPSTVIFDASSLKSLSEYQKKATMMDAFCHALESYWSVNSTEESRGYSRKAIAEILKNMDDYLQGKDDGNTGMLHAANIAGKAINIARTTAGHALCYKLTTKFGIAHGHAAALCVRKLWPMLVERIDDKCCDPRGEHYLKGIFDEISDVMGTANVTQASEKFENIFDAFELCVPAATEIEIKQFTKEVNVDRLKNTPIDLTTEDIEGLYKKILNKSMN